MDVVLYKVGRDAISDLCPPGRLQRIFHGLESKIFKFRQFFLITFSLRDLLCISEGTADDISLLTNFDVTKVLAEIPARNGHPSLPFRYFFVLTVCLSILTSQLDLQSHYKVIVTC